MKISDRYVGKKRKMLQGMTNEQIILLSNYVVIQMLGDGRSALMEALSLELLKRSGYGKDTEAVQP